MKHILKTIAVIILTYLIFSFLTLDLNPLNWIECVRFIFIVVTIGFIVIVYIGNEDNNE